MPSQKPPSPPPFSAVPLHGKANQHGVSETTIIDAQLKRQEAKRSSVRDQRIITHWRWRRRPRRAAKIPLDPESLIGGPAKTLLPSLTDDCDGLTNARECSVRDAAILSRVFSSMDLWNQRRTFGIGAVKTRVADFF